MIPGAGQYDRDIEQVGINDVDPQQDIKKDSNGNGRKYSNAKDGRLIRATRAPQEIYAYKNPSTPIYKLLINVFYIIWVKRLRG
jgi:hypothetical protein